jgi:CheY-like chemotaxis protein
MPKGQKPVILVVDDNEHNLTLIGKLVESAGYEAVLASSGSQALEFLAAEHPDLILLDVMMPEMDGYALCDQLKRDEAFRELPVLFLTAKADADDVARGFAAGAVDYIAKPFHAAELRARVRTHLELKLQRDALARRTAELEQALSQVKTLRGLLPICAWCKKIRNDQGYWDQLESYLSVHTDATFSHAICPDCAERNFLGSDG